MTDQLRFGMRYVIVFVVLTCGVSFRPVPAAQ